MPTWTDPYCRIHRCVGQRSMPDDWPSCYDTWDAYDQDGAYLLTLDYQALGQLLGTTVGRPPHAITLDWNGGPDEGKPIVILPTHTFNLTLSIKLGDGIVVENPDVLVSREELLRHIDALFRKGGP